jgi:hypothetical protein
VDPAGLTGRNAVIVVNHTATDLVALMADAALSRPMFVNVSLR